MSAAGPVPSFEAPIVAMLERAGLKGGMATVRLEDGTLRLSGDSGGDIAIAAGDVERIRIVRFAGGRRPALHETRIWRGGGAEPLLILAPPHHSDDYGAVIRGFASRVAAIGGMDRVSRGPGLATALVQLMLVAFPLILLAGFLLILATDGGSLWLWVAAGLAAAVAAGLVAGLLRHRWPRPIRSLDELDDELPPAGGLPA